MSSILTPQGVVVATAMAVSGTFILFALRLQKNFPATYQPRSCISSEKKRRDRKKKKVHFAEDVVDQSGNSEDFRKQHKFNHQNTPNDLVSICQENREMPANRAALYQGMLKNRVAQHRFACSY